MKTRLPLIAAVLLLPACSLFSQTPDAATRSKVRAAVPYGVSADTAAEKLSGLGFSCARRTGNYSDESGQTHSAEHFLYCQERPGPISFTCLNRDLVTVVLRSEQVAGIEVTRGPSCERN